MQYSFKISKEVNKSKLPYLETMWKEEDILKKAWYAWFICPGDHLIYANIATEIITLLVIQTLHTHCSQMQI